MRYTLAALSLTAFVACTTEEEPTPTLSIPTTYEFNRDGVSTVSFGGQIARQDMLRELSTEMKSGVENTLDADHLFDMYENTNSPFSDADLNTSGKSLSTKTSASAIHVINQGNTINFFKGWMQAAATASAANATAADGTAGVIQNTDGTKKYLVNEQGVEYVQLIEKGLMGAVFMDQTVNNYLTTLKLDVDNTPENGNPYTDMEHHWDEGYGYFTVQQDLELDYSVSQDRGFWGRYIVGLEAEFGLADQIYYAFRKGRAAIVAGEYDTRDEQIAPIAEGFEEATYLKALGYLNKGAADLSSGNAAAAFHELSEGLGFIYSLRFGTSGKVSAAQSDEWIEDLTTGSGFWSGDILSRIEQVKTEIGTAYQLPQTIVDGSH
ncbi:MAG: DUF4856 domain-containing protein [Flavobacteriia bacterium]|nr:DUF4856 domain-containing protein [Flavobacteriia bacterium]